MDLTYSFMIPLLENLVQATHSYGWAIVALTVIVRVLMWPLVAKQTESMQKMSKISPLMKEIQTKFKDNPEKMQKLLAELMMKNKANPVGGCLPMLIQFPIFIALFATFSGPPFGDKPIEAYVKVSKDQIERKVEKETTDAELPYVGMDGAISKVTVYPGEIKISPGQEVDFGSRAVDGELAKDYKPTWAVFKDNKAIKDDAATIDKMTGHAVFNEPGEYKVVATIHGVAKNESFGFINGLGKVCTGFKLLKPENFDALVLILGFGITMHFSSKLNTGMQQKKDEPLDEQQRVMQDSMKFMPIVLTGTFVFIPLPVGVLVYMVVSNIIQTFQTWLMMRRPAPAIINVLEMDMQAGDDIVAETVPPTSKDVVELPNNGKDSAHNKIKTNQSAKASNKKSQGNTTPATKSSKSTKRRTKKKKKK